VQDCKSCTARGNKLGEAKISYEAYKRINMKWQTSRFSKLEDGNWILSNGDSQDFEGAIYGRGEINMENVPIPENAKVVLHTHELRYGAIVESYPGLGIIKTANPYTPSTPDIDYLISHPNLMGAILTNRSLILYNQNVIISEQLNSPLMRYFPNFLFR
jgi:hypothetical protein